MKLRTLAIAALICASLGAAPASADVPAKPRIWQGWPARVDSVPSMAAILVTQSGGPKRSFLCGGTVIAPRVVLTAAHCLQGRRSRILANVSVMTGRTTLTPIHPGQPGQRSPIVDYATHEFFSKRRGYENDIAVILLRDETVAPPAAIDVSRSTFQSLTLDVAGWGRLGRRPVYPTSLQTAGLKVIPQSVCKRAYRGMPRPSLYVCAFGENEGVCDGDSGGPLSLPEGTLVGLTSGGSVACRLGGPAVFTRVGRYIDWMRARIEQFAWEPGTPGSAIDENLPGGPTD